MTPSIQACRTTTFYLGKKKKIRNSLLTLKTPKIHNPFKKTKILEKCTFFNFFIYYSYNNYLNNNL